MIATYNDLGEDVIIRHEIGYWNVFYTNQVNFVSGPIFSREAMVYIPGSQSARVFVIGAKESEMFVPGAQESR